MKCKLTCTSHCGMHEVTAMGIGMRKEVLCVDGDGKKFIGDGAGMGLIFTTVSLFSNDVSFSQRKTFTDSIVGTVPLEHGVDDAL